MYVEKRVGNEWQFVFPEKCDNCEGNGHYDWTNKEGEKQKCFSCDGTGKMDCDCRYAEDQRDCYDCLGFKKRGEGWYGSRNYDVFAILANVRNGYGFAGIPTGGGFNIIAPPRGFPEDMSEIMKQFSEHVEHTPTWLKLSEILDYDWDQHTTHCGVVNELEYTKWATSSRKLAPENYSGGIMGKGIVTYDELTYLRLKEQKQLGKDRVYVQVEWPVTYRQSCSHFLKAMEELKRLGPPEDVRLVFWFDS